jgi:hypothetical protein
MDWEGARRKDLARKEVKPRKRIAGKGSAVDSLFRLRAQIKRVDDVDWATKTERQKQVALADLELFRGRVLGAMPGITGKDLDREAQAAAEKLRAALSPPK